VSVDPFCGISSENIDMSSMKGTDYTATKDTYIYKLSVCGITQDADCSKASGSICQYFSNPVSYYHKLASFTVSPLPTWSLIDAQDPTKGVQVAFVNGDGCRIGAIGVFLQFPCISTEGPNTFTVTPASDMCSFQINFPTRASCPGSNDGGSGKSGLSGGSIFLIILVVSISVYLIVGCIYLRKVKGTVGMKESCPNGGFWTALPGLVKDGLAFTWAKLRGLCGGKGEYESMK